MNEAGFLTKVARFFRRIHFRDTVLLRENAKEGGQTIRETPMKLKDNKQATDLILVGCVKTKIDTGGEVEAKDLYDSRLWRCRRGYAERFARFWYILSAKHCLLHPDEKIGTYDLTMTDMNAKERRNWSDRVWKGLTGKFPDLKGKVVEIHAGKAYAESGLEKELRAAGAIVHRPLKRVIGIEPQCAWYGECLDSARSAAREDIERTSCAARLAEALAADFYAAGSGRWGRMPEVECARLLRARGEGEPTVRLFLTFVSAMDRARDAGSLWKNAFGLFESNPELFDPSRVAGMSIRTLWRLLRGSGVSRRHSQDVPAWRRIAESLRSRSCSPVRRAIDGGVGNAEELLEDLRGCDRAGNLRFPLLQGPKIGAMWVRIMANPGRAQIKNMAAVPVAVDRHVRRLTEDLGVTDTRDCRSTEKAAPAVQHFWKKAVDVVDIGGPDGIAGTGAALDPALWYFGKNGLASARKTRRLLEMCED